MESEREREREREKEKEKEKEPELEIELPPQDPDEELDYLFGRRRKGFGYEKVDILNPVVRDIDKAIDDILKGV